MAVLSHLQGYASYYNWGVYVPTEVCNLIVIVVCFLKPAVLDPAGVVRQRAAVSSQGAAGLMFIHCPTHFGHNDAHAQKTLALLFLCTILG